MEQPPCYIAIDLKSFYASVECRERGLDPLTTNLVVADTSRTEKTICLAVSPSLRSYGIPGRARLFEVLQHIQHINSQRQLHTPKRTFTGSSWDASALARDPSLSLDYILAPPQMALYEKYSTLVYRIYLDYISPEDIHVYSIDEVFINAAPYLRSSGLTPQQFTQNILQSVWKKTGITATAGIGTNLYLCKVALDILAKHAPPNIHGARIALLDEHTYRSQLWEHRPLTDFWRVGPGISKKLTVHGIFTMGDIARCSMVNEALLYQLFGINAELLIDHAWGWEPCTIPEIKAYRPNTSSLSSGQVLQCPYPSDKARLIIREMTDAMALELVDRRLVTDQLTLTVGYDRENLSDPIRQAAYAGTVITDRYGRRIPKYAHGTASLERHTASARLLIHCMLELFDRIVDPMLSVRRLTISANHIIPEEEAASSFCQLNLFANATAEEAALEREHRRQLAELTIKKKYGKNAILKGMSFRDGATARIRNQQIGGHRA